MVGLSVAAQITGNDEWLPAVEARAQHNLSVTAGLFSATMARVGLALVAVQRNDVAAAEGRLAEDRWHEIKAVCVVHNETSTGVTAPIADLRAAIDRAGHPALLLVDTISSLASIDYRHDEWGVDVTVGGSQKGLMLPPGLSFNAISDKALAAAKRAKLGEEGLDNVFARHTRLAEATRRAVEAWGLEVLCLNPSAYSASLTAVLMPPGHDADDFRRVVLDRFDLSLGNGLGKIQGKVFRIGHLGDFNALMLGGTLAGVEMGLAVAGVPYRKGGVLAALDYLAEPDAPAVAEPVRLQSRGA